MAETMRNMIDEWREISNAPIVGPCTHYVTKSYGECATEAEAQWQRLVKVIDDMYAAGRMFSSDHARLLAILGTPDAKESE